MGANLRKKEKTNGLVGANNRGGIGQPKKKRENEWISRGLKQGAGQAKLRKREKTNGIEVAKNRGVGWANQRKKEKMNGLVGAENRGRAG